MLKPNQITDRQRASAVYHDSWSGFREYHNCYVATDDDGIQLYIFESASDEHPRAVIPYRTSRIVW